MESRRKPSCHLVIQSFIYLFTSQYWHHVFFLPQGCFRTTQTDFKPDWRDLSSQRWFYISKSVDFFFSSILRFWSFLSHVAPLKDNFDILLGSIEITVPQVEDGDDYRIVCEYLSVQSLLNQSWTPLLVFGDSGNWSPPFSIRNHWYHHDVHESQRRRIGQLRSSFLSQVSLQCFKVDILVDAIMFIYLIFGLVRTHSTNSPHCTYHFGHLCGTFQCKILGQFLYILDFRS